MVCCFVDRVSTCLPDQLRAEIETMKKLQHKNIIKYFEAFENEVCPGLSSFYVPI